MSVIDCVICTRSLSSKDFKRNVMNALFREERFKEFQKRRCVDQVMDVDDDDDEWLEQQRVRTFSIIVACGRN